MLGLVGLSLSGTNGQGGSAPAGDALADALAALEAAGKLVCAWFLPSATPSQYLTLSGADVNGWDAAYGTQKVNLAVETAAPQWDATLFSNKGGVTFNGTTQRLLGTGNVTNWPIDTDDLYMIVGMSVTTPSGFRRVFSYGNTSSTQRALGTNTGPVSASLAAATSITGSGSVTGGHAVGIFFDMGGTSQPYLDGSADGAGTATASAALTRTRVRLGANSASSATQFFQGTLSCAAILNSTASLSDFTALSTLMQARVT